MEISTEKNKMMTNNTSGINKDIKVNKCLGSVITDEGSKPEILSRIVQTTRALTRLKPVWNDSHVSLSSKMSDSLPCHIHLLVCFGIIDPHSRTPKKNTSHGNEMLPQDTTHLSEIFCGAPITLTVKG